MVIIVNESLAEAKYIREPPYLATRAVKHDVSRFHVPVYDPSRMHKVQGLVRQRHILAVNFGRE